MTITATPPVTTVAITRLNCPVCGSGEVGDCVCPPRPAVDPERTAAMERVHDAVKAHLGSRRLYAVHVEAYPAGGVVSVTGLAAYDVIARFTDPGVIVLERRAALDWTVKGTLTVEGMDAASVADVIVGLLGH